MSKLPPGHLLVRRSTAARRASQAYWDLSFGPKLTGSDDDLLDELEEKLEDTLRLHMMSDVPVGALLSGGLDSSLLVAMLAKQRRREKSADVHRGPAARRTYDEAPHARTVAQLYGTRASRRLALTDADEPAARRRPSSRRAIGSALSLHLSRRRRSRART